MPMPQTHQVNVHLPSNSHDIAHESLQLQALSGMSNDLLHTFRADIHADTPRHQVLVGLLRDLNGISD